MSLHTITLPEWKTATPASHPVLRGLYLERNSPAEALARKLTKKRRLKIVERRDGLEVETLSYVGAITVGPLRIVIEPKIPGPALLQLLRYAYGFRDLELHDEHQGQTASACLQDLLLLQLAAEARELLGRGLHRKYTEQRDRLAVPRGRVDFRRLAAGGGLMKAELPCQFHERDEDCLPNQVLLAGLQLGSRLTSDEILGTRLRQLARQLADTVSPIALESSTLLRLQRERNRLFSKYAPSFALIRLLLESAGASAASMNEVELRGFLFDMNRFFERLLLRFLTEYLPDCQIIGQKALHRMFSYDPAHNPKHRRAPRPRPDFIVRDPGREPAILDAKYRDLWKKRLPREMLYQLAMYASGHAGNRTAAILYPTANSQAQEQRILVAQPLTGSTAGSVVLRPVHVVRLAELLPFASSASNQEILRSLASRLAFGLP